MVLTKFELSTETSFGHQRAWQPSRTALTPRTGSQPRFGSSSRTSSSPITRWHSSTVRPTTPLIIVTGHPNSDKTVACLRAGAEDLLIKGNLGRLAAAITAAFDLRRPLEALTPRQIEVLRLVSEGHRTRDIASRLKLSVKTVESHRGEVMKRLEIHDVVNLVRYALRVGLVSL